MGVKWVLLASIPLIGSCWHAVSFDPSAALSTAMANDWIAFNYVDGDASPSFVYSESLGDMFKDMGSSIRRNPEAVARCGGFWRLFGAGNLIILLGSLLAEFGLIMGVVGGAKQNKKATQAKRMKAAERKRK